VGWRDWREGEGGESGVDGKMTEAACSFFCESVSR